MTEFTIDHRRLDIISQLNRGSDEFEDLKKETFYYDEKLKCWLSKIEDEEDGWYCEECNKEMKASEEGPTHNDVAYCSQECIDERKAQE